MAGPEAAQLPIAAARSAQPSTGEPRTTRARTASTGRAALRTALPAAAQTAPKCPQAEATQAQAARAEAADGRAPAGSGRTAPGARCGHVRPGPDALARQGLRPADSAPLRRVGTRLHPTGVRACSDRGCARERLTAALPVPQTRPSLPGDAPQSLRLTRRGRVVLAVASPRSRRACSDSRRPAARRSWQAPAAPSGYSRAFDDPDRGPARADDLVDRDASRPARRSATGRPPDHRGQRAAWQQRSSWPAPLGAAGLRCSGAGPAWEPRAHGGACSGARAGSPLGRAPARRSGDTPAAAAIAASTSIFSRAADWPCAPGVSGLA